MKRKTPVSRKNIIKRNLRLKISKLKLKVRNSKGAVSWDVRELFFNQIRKAKYPKIIIRDKVKVRKVANKKVPLKAPVNIDYYYNKDKNIEVMNRFLSDLRDCAGRAERRVFIDFSETKLISAAAMLSFLAEVDVLIKKSKHGVNAISFAHPKDEKIESILKQVGFYDLLKKDKRETKDFDDVTFWKYTSGTCSEPMLASNMINEIKKELEAKNSRKLYRGFIEAMSNSVEHAYVDDIEHNEEEKTAKWWTFAGIKEGRLVVVICDKGVGIPATLPKTQGVTVLEVLFRKIGVSLHNVKDSSYIKAAATLSKTRTGQANRGKGLTDITSVIDTIGAGVLSIFSNKGRYIYKGNQGVVRDLVKDYRSSVCGTIIEWTIPFEGEV
ncbi:ATP-binding protein [Serratia bockelmannii]|uniref:ATP-binding protein n=1 Tax=Serratia TaxID=613 RepID=UPI00313AB752